MTAGVHAAGVQLICDGCDTTTVAGGGPMDRDAVSAAVAGTGWTGSPFVGGLHRCPDCSGGGGSPELAPLGIALTEIAIAVTEPAVVVRVTGDVDMHLVDDLRSTLDNAVTLRPFVIVDLTAARSADAAGLGVLIRSRREARRQRGDLVVVASREFARGQLRARRPHVPLRTYETVPQAITAALGPH